jgi:hypothetical protein
VHGHHRNRNPLATGKNSTTLLKKSLNVLMASMFLVRRIGVGMSSPLIQLSFGKVVPADCMIDLYTHGTEMCGEHNASHPKESL